MDESFRPREPLSASKLNALRQQMRGSELQPGPGIRISRIHGQGTFVEAEEETVSWEHPWKVRMKGTDKLDVAPGLLNGVMPWLTGTSGSLRPMDGLDENGKKHSQGKPSLSFRPSGDSVWVCLKVKVVEGIFTPADGGLTLDFSSASTWRDGGSRDDKGVGLYPLAWMRRVKGSWKIYQIAMFCLQHRFTKATDNTPARHWFWV